MKRRLRILILLLACSITSVCFAQKAIKVGVLHKDSLSGYDYDWDATIKTLGREIHEQKFEMIELSWLELKEAVAQKEVDFVIASPIFCVEVGFEGDLNIIATLKRQSEKQRGFEELYGSVIFWRADNDSIKSLWNIKNKKVAAGSILSIGGWLAVAREFAERGIDLKKYCSSISHYYDNEKVVEEVLSGKVDFGICRTSILEAMQDAGQLNLEDLKISNDFVSHKLPFACSTRLYPEWSFALISGTSEILAEKVTVALFKMTDEIGPMETTWGIPANYSQVNQLMKTLHMEPFDSDNSIFQSALKTLRKWLAAFFVAILILGTAIFFLLRLNFRLKKVSDELQEQRAFLKHLIDSIPDLIFVKSQSGRFLLCNRAFSEAFELPAEQIHDKTELELFPDGSPFIEGDERIRNTGQSVKFTKKLPISQQRSIYGEIIKVSCQLTDTSERKIVGIVRDVSANYRARQIQRQREKLITGIAEAAHRVVGSEKSLEASMPGALDSIAKAVEADRVGILKKGLLEDEANYFECFSCRFNPSAACMPGTRELVSKIIVANHEKVLAGHILGRTIYDFSNDFREALKKVGINSLLILPVFVHHKFWGCMEVHSFETAREWHEYELAALELAAEMFGSMIERSEDFSRLLDYRDRLRLALDSAGLFLWEFDFSNSLNLTPDDLYKNLGYIEPEKIEEARMLGFNIIHPEDLYLIKNIAQNETCQFEVRLCSNNDRYIWHSFIGRNYFDSSHRHLKLIGFFRNTSSEHEREMALRMEESRNVHALTAARAASWEFVPEESRFYWSGHVKNLLGYNPEIFSPNIESVFQVIHPEDLPAAKAAVRRFIVSGKELRFDCRLRKFDGTYSWFANIGTQVKDPELANIRYYGIIIDISETRILQQNLLEARNNAEEMARQAQMASQAKTSFLANMSHEIRTPMNGILGMLELLLATDLNPRQKEFANIIYRSSHSLLGILNAILDLSKIEAGKLSLEPLNINLKRVVEEVVSLMEPVAEKKKIELILRYPPEIPEHVVADGGRIRQILTNLVNNAVKFTEEGFVTIEVSAVINPEDDNEARFTFSIKDTGIGMTEEQQALVFEKFNQADTSITRRFGGTGLGLTICKELISLMGGKINLESASDLGTRIWFSIDLQLIGKFSEGEKSFDEKVLVIVAGENEPVRETVCEIISSWNVNYEKVDLDKVKDKLSELKDLDSKIITVVDFPTDVKNLEVPDFDLYGNLAGCIFLMTPKQLTKNGHLESTAGKVALIGKPVTDYKLYEAARELLIGSESRIHTYFNRKQAEKEHEKRQPGDKFDLKVLIVEDNEINQEVAVGIFDLFGCKSKVASSGKEALNMIQTDSFDAVFLDCQMPEMDGFEVVKRIRKIEGEVSKIPVIAMTAHSMPGDKEKCLNAGMNNYIAKPINPDYLAKILEKLKNNAPPDKKQQETENEPENFAASATDLVLDRERVTRIFANKVPALEKIFKACRKTVEKNLQQAQHAIEKESSAELVKAFHTIKGSLGNLGGNESADLAEQIENAADSADFEKASLLIPEFKDSLNRFIDELADLLKELKQT